MREHTRAKWMDRMRQWRASGLSAKEFTTGKEYGAGGLRWAVSQLGAAEEWTRPEASRAPKARRRARVAERSVVPAPRAPRLLPVRVRPASPVVAEIVVEVGGARIRVTPDVDIALLGNVVRALQGVGR